ncbi:MAG: XrtA system polysaccharide chain length determinant [Candidatus Korobacteraceae bacterium]
MLTAHDYWHILLRRRWWLIGSLFGCWLLAWGASRLLPSVYRSETLILVEQQKVPEQYVVSNVSVDLQEQLQSMTQQILSRTRLELIIQKFHLYTQQRQRLGPDGLVDQMRKDIQIQLVEAPGRRGQLTAFRIIYSAPTPTLAQQVATQLTTLFIDENIQEQSQRAENTTEFLSSELTTARTSLSEQEVKVKQFKSHYLGELPSQMDGNVHILSGLQERYHNLAQAMNRAQEQRLYMESLLTQYRAVRTGGETGANSLPSIDHELSKMKADLAEAQTRYTSKHPDVIRLKGLIAKTEKLKSDIEADEAKAPQDGDKKHPTNSSELQSMAPMLQLEGQLKANEQEIQDARNEMQTLQTQIAEYQSRLNLTPIREQQLADLTRDYEQSKANYDSLLKKQMQSQLATNLEKRQQGKGFRIIDPPSFAHKPYSPDRVKFSLAGLIAGLLVGFGLVFLSEFLDDSIREQEDITRMTNVRVLAGIPHLATPADGRKRSRRRILEWCGAALIFIVMVCANVFTFYRG